MQKIVCKVGTHSKMSGNKGKRLHQAHKTIRNSRLFIHLFIDLSRRGCCLKVWQAFANVIIACAALIKYEREKVNVIWRHTYSIFAVTYTHTHRHRWRHRQRQRLIQATDEIDTNESLLCVCHLLLSRLCRDFVYNFSIQFPQKTCTYVSNLHHAAYD